MLLHILERKIPPYTLMLILLMLIQKIKFNLFIIMKLHALKNSFLQPQALFSSENLRQPQMSIQENQIKNPLLASLNHWQFQLFSNSLRMKLKQYLDNNNQLPFFLEINPTVMLNLFQFLKKLQKHLKVKLFSHLVVFQMEFKKN